MVSAVSFGNTTQASSFADKIKQPQTFTVKEQPSAAASIKGGKKKHSAGKTFLRLVLGAAAISAGLVALTKKGKLAPTEGGNAILEKIKAGANKAGTFLSEHFDSLAAKLKDKAPEAVNELA